MLQRKFFSTLAAKDKRRTYFLRYSIAHKNAKVNNRNKK